MRVLIRSEACYGVLAAAAPLMAVRCSVFRLNGGSSRLANARMSI